MDRYSDSDCNFVVEGSLVESYRIFLGKIFCSKSFLYLVLKVE